MASTSRSSSAKPRPVHYVLSTHWDREWLQPFQVFRHRLVRLMDRTIRALESGELKGPFTTDGQAILLEDYLEVRPRNRARVERLVRRGRLNVGPWYVLPEEWLISGESYVRNLRLGRQIVRDFGGKPSDAGFACDLFGHISQLPQIFAGFGIKGAFIWRGLEPRASAHFLWEAADGTRLPTYRFGRAGYGDYAYQVRRGTQLDTWFDAARSRADHLAFITREAARSKLPPVLVFDGCDHLEFDSDHYRVLQSLKPKDGLPGPIRHSTLDDYLADLLPHARRLRDIVRGELREYASSPLIEDQQWLIPGVVSSRVDLKQANAVCQNTLCHWAEPFGHLAHVFAGADSPEDFLAVAWRWLLQNHPHDSIGGCSIDAVHAEMHYRFAQSRQIGDRVTSEALRILAASVEGPIGPNELRVLVANPLPKPLHEPIELTLQIPAQWRSFNEFFGFEPKPGFRIFGPDGREIPYQRVAQDPDRTKYRASSPFKFPVPYKTHDVTVALRVPLPALGYTTLTVREGEMSAHDDIVAAQMLPTRHPTRPGLATSERSMENRLLAVTIESNGTLTLRDKRSGEVYSRLLTFEDAADIGDGWYHGPAVNDQAFVSTAAQSDVALIADGPLLARFKIRTILNVPAEFDFTRMVRSPQSVALEIESLVTLRAESERVEVRILVKNIARDHRMRVFFPSGARTDTYVADSVFDVVERPIALPAKNHLARELAVETGAHQSWSAVSDRKRGLAIVTSGLLECCVRDQPERPLALTLFRSTRRTVMTDGQPGGQLQGDLSAEFWIVPLRGAPARSQLCGLGIQLGAGLRTAQLTDYDAKIVTKTAKLPRVASLFEVTGEVIVTSARAVDGALEVRFFNPHAKKVTAALDFRATPSRRAEFTKVQLVNLESTPLRPARRLRGPTCRLTVAPKRIVTLRFT